jgi:hypothetical protein
MSEIAAVLEAMSGLRNDFKEYKEEMMTYRNSIELRIRTLEDWKLSFVTKLTAYCAVALFLGSIISQVGIHMLTNYLAK